jgi:hypothetical protein
MNKEDRREQFLQIHPDGVVKHKRSKITAETIKKILELYPYHTYSEITEITGLVYSEVGTIVRLLKQRDLLPEKTIKSFSVQTQEAIDEFIKERK